MDLAAKDTNLVGVRGRAVRVLRSGSGTPIVYLHGFADVHGVAESWLPFHEELARHGHLIAPAHPGIHGSDEYEDLSSIEDVVFHYLELFDALGLDRFALVGHCVGGWIAAEIAARHPEKVERLALVGASGLFLSGQPIGDVFLMAQPENGTSNAGLRALLFRDPDDPSALRYFPDGRGDLEEELRRYEMLRFGSFVGFKPPYFYNRALINRLHRISCPALIIWGEQDRMVPPAHGTAYAQHLPHARLETIAGAGHAVHIERTEETARLVTRFLKGE